MRVRDGIDMLLIVAVLCGLSACSTDSSARQVAGRTAGLVNEFKRATESFIDQTNDLETANNTRLRRLAEQTKAIEINADVARIGWETIQDDRARGMYAALTKEGTSGVVANSAALFLLKPPAAPAPIALDPKQFNSLIQKLSALAAEPSFEDLVGSWMDYGKQVNNALQKDMKDSGTKLTETKTTTGQKDKNLTSSK